MEEVFYVYEWIRLDTNEPFYVGKGKGNRCYSLTRGNNEHFNNIVENIPVVVNILHDKLSEQMAFDLEVWYIWQYRDVIGYDLVNISDGGTGHGLKGKLNGMYGVHRYSEEAPMYGKHHSEESKRKMSETKKGKNPYKGKTEEELREWKNNQSKSRLGKNYGIVGEKHHLYGKQRSKETKEKISKNRIGKYTGKNSPNSKSVICLTTKKIFHTLTEASKYYEININCIVGCCKGRIKSAGKLNGEKLIWKHLNWKHDKKYRVKK